MTKTKTRRLGRPPAATSAETRRRILVAAQKLFAQYGYDKTTNNDIAADAGLTTGALYHYFDSKQALFLAVLAEQQGRILERFEQAAAEQATVVEKLCAVLTCAADLHVEDEYVARFVSIAPIEIDRHEEFQVPGSAPRRSGGIAEFFTGIIELGIANGELRRGTDVQAVLNMLLAATSGLAQFAGFLDEPTAHRQAIDTFKMVLRGELFQTVARPQEGRGVGFRRRSKTG